MTTTRAAIVAVLVGMSLGACTKQGFLEAPKADPGVQARVGSFAGDTHFLLEPTGDAEDLLGRAVHVTSAGGWTIADERAPGCEVRVKRSLADYEKSYRIGLGDMTAMSGGYGDLLRLEARYGRSVEAEVKVHNLETLTADAAGPCGDVIVKSVRVGTGERRLQRKAEGGAKGRVGKGPIGIDAGREAATDTADEIRWGSPQAYAFTYETVAQRKVFEIKAAIPGQVRDGEQFKLTFHGPQDAYLVVLYLEADAQGAVLFPDDRVTVPKLRGGTSLVLPPKDHQPLAAKLRDPAVAARESVLVFAFADRGDYDRYRPGAFAEDKDVAGYAAALTEALAKVPISRWDRHIETIEILPNGSPAP
jgi:hypothetical protein